MFIHRIKLKNVLSFGPDSPELELRPLNVLIGPNGSGKSNLIEAIGLLKAVPNKLTESLAQNGGAEDWVWKGEPRASRVEIEIVLAGSNEQLMRHRLAFSVLPYVQVTHESLEDRIGPSQTPRIHFAFDGREATVNRFGSGDDGPAETMTFNGHTQQSILEQVRDPTRYPEFAHIAEAYRDMRLYRESFFGRNTPPRSSQKADLPNHFLLEDGSNLGLVLSQLAMRHPRSKQRILDALRSLYADVSDFHVNIEYGTVQVFFNEGDFLMPSTRLSDGTIRYLCLLTVLCHPKPPPLVCIEEPELGLHPDIIPGLAELLREASERCQLIVTTHSDTLVDALTDTPESVVVCQKEKSQTIMKRLDANALAHWLEQYRLGELWSSGELEGNRW